jgi:hypothetical protein
MTDGLVDTIIALRVVLLREDEYSDVERLDDSKCSRAEGDTLTLYSYF